MDLLLSVLFIIMNEWMDDCISKFKDDHASLAVASPGFVARRGKVGN